MKKKEWILEAAVCVFLFTALFVWGFVQPIENQPDERCRYLIPYYVMKHGRLPIGTDPELLVGGYGISYGFFPGLPYLIMAFFMKIASLFGANAFALLMSARCVNMLAGVGVFLIARRTADKLFRHTLTGWMFSLTAAFWPQVLFIFTYVNCDAFAYLSCAIMVYALVSGLKEGWNVRNYVVLAIGVSVCALSYYNAYGVILGSVVTFVLSFFYQKIDQNAAGASIYKTGFYFRECMRIGFTIVGIVFVLAGWWFIRNAILYEGDFIGLEANRRLAEIYAIDIFKPSMKVTLQNSGNPVWCLLLNAEFRFLLKQSFFGHFGNMDLTVPNYILRGFKIILLTGGIGLLLRNQGKAFAGWKRLAFASGMVIGAGTTFFLTYWYSYANEYQPQGRYLLPGLIPMLCLIMIGFQNLTDRILKIKKGEWIVRFLYAAAFLYIGISTLGCILLIYGQYYGRLAETMHMIFRGGPL